MVPADKKWYRDHVVSKHVVAAMEALNMQYPKPTVDLSKIRID
jgi:hypothetical protein